ncbi:MAG TPA: YciI family protein [Jatrophihabitans sp.]|nr:YciI family protein [Jatrophihabitans sp.]
MAYHLMRTERGPAWDHSRGLREQRDWDAHAAYLDRLAEHGVVVLGGPVSGDDGTVAVLIVEAFDEAAVRALFTVDPWMGSILNIKSIEPWSIWLRSRAVAVPA